MSAAFARANLHHQIDQVNEESHPLTITGHRGNEVLVSEGERAQLVHSMLLSHACDPSSSRQTTGEIRLRRRAC